jgi:16S rRNA G966 N2-methylase RsmD
VDPPYERTADLGAALAALGAGASGWLADDACVAAKHFWRSEPGEAVGRLRLVRRRRFGETSLSVYRRER